MPAANLDTTLRTLPPTINPNDPKPHPFHTGSKFIYMAGTLATRPCDWCAQPPILALLPYPACVTLGRTDEHCANVTYYIGDLSFLEERACFPRGTEMKSALRREREARLEEVVLRLELEGCRALGRRDESTVAERADQGRKVLEAVRAWLDELEDGGEAKG